MIEQKWQSMDSAPKDGSHILIYWKEGSFIEGYYEEKWEGTKCIPRFLPVSLKYHGCLCCSEPSIPVAWQPLPSRPEFL